jgi:CheY-like chemotaxis protein
MATILILDDRATNRNIYARLAAAIEDNVSAEVFADPADALEWLEHNRVDLVITDYKMPGMDGAEFTRRFRAMPNNRHVPVVVITAYDDRSFRLRALDAGATDFLQSPVDHFEIVVRARNLLALGRRMAAGAAAGEVEPARVAPSPGAAATEPAASPTAAGATADPWRILDALPALVSVTDREGRRLYANAASAAAAAAADSEPAPAPFRPEDRGRDRERDREGDLAVFAAGRPLAPYPEDAPGKVAGAAGRRRLLTFKAPLRDAAGQVVAVLTTSFELPGGTAAGDARQKVGPETAPGAD